VPAAMAIRTPEEEWCSHSGFVIVSAGVNVAEVLVMKEQKRYLLGKRAYESWKKRFSESFDADTRPRDLSDTTLSALIEGSEEASMPLYELIMGVLGLGKGPRFYSLETSEIMLVTDITLFLLDQLRFEALRRLGWIDDWHTVHIPLLDLVEQFSTTFSNLKRGTPRLSSRHPRFQEYLTIFEADQGPFIRRLIPQAVKLFQERQTVP